MKPNRTNNLSSSPPGEPGGGPLSGLPDGMMADSKEVVRSFYEEKINSLQQELGRLNLLDHAQEITGICKEIMKTRQQLLDAYKKKD